MKKVIYTLLSIVVMAVAITSCSKEETYAEQRDRENARITAFIKNESNLSKALFPQGIEVINEIQFNDQGCVTLAPPAHPKTQFVLFGSSGVYMHIADKGNGNQLDWGESKNVLCRFAEYNINNDELSPSMSNMHDPLYAGIPDVLAITNNTGTFTASFLSGVMTSVNQNAEVPAGWLVPFSYIKLGRPMSHDSSLAHVYLIVPHSKGHARAQNSVYACLYDITFEETENQ